MKALVTGATGFIGSVLTRELMHRGHDVRALVLPSEDAHALEELGVEVRHGDLTQPRSLHQLCDGIDTLFHLAARVTDWGRRELFYMAIYDATKYLVHESLGKVSRFVYISSLAALGLSRDLKGFKETDQAIKCGIPYGDAKLDTEQLLLELHQAGKISVTIIRPSNVTGPGSVWVRDIVEKMLKLPVPLIEGGRYSSSMIYVDNLVDGIIRAGTQDVAKGKIYHLRDDWNVSWKQYLTDLAAYVGKRPWPSVPLALIRPVAWFFETVCTPFNIRPLITRMTVDIIGHDLDFDASLAQSELGWRTTIAYPEAMAAIGSWIKAHYSI